MKRTLAALALSSLVLGMPQTAVASVIAVDVSFFGAGSTLTTFGTLEAEVDGLTIDGLEFSYSLGPGHLAVTDAGPPATNNVAPNFIASIGDDDGVLTVRLPSPTEAFGFGFSLFAFQPIPNAVTVTVFDNGTALGSLSFDALPDPDFPGGFAGIASTDPFTRVEITFGSPLSTAFAMDNIRTLPVAAVPEPVALALLGVGIAGLARQRQRRTRRSV